MAQPAEHLRITPSIVTSIEEAIAVRRAPNPPGRTDDSPGAQLLQAMHTVKSARFNAAERFERKHLLAVFAMSMVSLYFVGLSVWQAVYAAALSDATNRLITLVSILSSIFTLVLALIESMNDYKMKAHHMRACALAVSDLLHELIIANSNDAAVVQAFRKRYNEAVRGCPLNHARVDYLMARAQREVPLAEKLWANARYAVDVYGLYGLCLIIPPLVLLVWV